MEGLVIPSVENLTPVGLYILLALMLLLRKIVPIGALRDEQKTTAYWREVADKKDATIQNLTETNRLLTDGVGKTVEKVMGELQSRARDGSDA